MDRQTTIAFVLIGIILMAWLFLNQGPEPKKDNKPKTTQVEEAARAAESAKQSAKVEEATKAAAKAEVMASADTIGIKSLFKSSNVPESIITVDNEVARFEISSQGAKIRRVFLKQYKNWYSPDSKSVENLYQTGVMIVDAASESNLDIKFETNDRNYISTAGLDFKTSESRYQIQLKGDDSISIKYVFATRDNRSITKTFTFYGKKYNSRLTLGLNNITPLLREDKAYELHWDSGINFVEHNSVDEANFANSSAYQGNEQVKVDAPKKDSITKDFGNNVEWLCFRNKYFANVIAPDNVNEVQSAQLSGHTKHFAQNEGTVESYKGYFKLSAKDSNFVTSFLIYTGPINYDILKEYNRHLDKAVDFGSFLGLSFIVRPIAEYVFLPMFTFLHSFIPNYGVVILLFSIIVKLLLQPLSKQSMVSMQKMQALAPKIAELKEKFKDDPTKVNKETMKLYSTYGINPAGGCLPMLLQMPIFVALWGMFQTSIALRQQPFIWWIKDLSQPDVIFSLGFKLPLFGVNDISALALLMGVATFVQQKMTTKDPSQKAMIYMMPVMLTFLFMSFPAGLNLYYFLFNVLSIGQQYYIQKYSKPIELVPVKKANNKKGFFERMSEAAEQRTKDSKSSKKK